MPLYEGKTVGEAMRKALGIEAKKTGKPFGASKTGTIGGRPKGRIGKIRQSTTKQDDTTNPYATSAAVSRARERAINDAKRWISRADVSPGALERAIVYLYDKHTGHRAALIGDRRGFQSANGISFYFSHNRDSFRYSFRVQAGRYVVLATAHSHPEEQEIGTITERRQIRRRNSENEGLSPRDGDNQLVQICPVILKTPTRVVREFQKPGGYDN